MKIAVTYENGEVYQHFGHTENFKIYEVEDGKVVSSEVIGSNGSGHGALAGLLADNSIDVLICGGIGDGAQEALVQNGIELCAGTSGNADEAVEAYLRGELVNTGANCDHHDEDHSCGEQEFGGCHGCTGCGPAPQLGGPNAGKLCRVHYLGTFDDGSKFDSSYDRGEPLEFVCGSGMMIPGFDLAVSEMEVGEKRKIHLTPDEAYGPKDPGLIFKMEIAKIPGAEKLTVGSRVFLNNDSGQPFPASVTNVTDTTITFDVNHEMAGRSLNFEIELLEAK